MRYAAVLAVLCVLGFTAATPTAAEYDGIDPHVRSESVEGRKLMAIASRRSAIIRSLIERVSASDVVVYVEAALVLPGDVGGQTSFISKAGGRRYLRIQLDCLQSRHVQIALLGHELQHAVEIAGTAEVVDQSSLAAFYRRISRINRHRVCRFDTVEAIATGEHILAELAEEAKHKNTVLDTLRSMFRDTVKSRWLMADGRYRRQNASAADPRFRVQEELQREVQRSSLARETAGVTFLPEHRQRLR